MLTPTGSAQQPVNGIDEHSGDVGTLKTIKDTAADSQKEKSRQLTLTNFRRVLENFRCQIKFSCLYAHKRLDSVDSERYLHTCISIHLISSV